MHQNGRKRVVIQNVIPSINHGMFPAKRVQGEEVRVTADIFSDGHQQIDADLLILYPNSKLWISTPMRHSNNDRWEAIFSSDLIGTHKFTIEAWVDHFGTWQKDLKKKIAAGQDVTIEFQIGKNFFQELLPLADGEQQKTILAYQEKLDSTHAEKFALDPEVLLFVRQFKIPYLTTRFTQELEVYFGRRKALFSSWYELFPRSCGKNGHGTFKDVGPWIPKIAGMGFDVLYLPPIHPIGYKARKGKNNSIKGLPKDPGSPWAIGSPEGGHDAIHPELGTMQDLKNLMKLAAEHGLETALDLAFQCSPDHPYVKEHPEWFSWRPDGTVQYAENPPKKYEDIIPINFESKHWQELWQELLRVTLFWVNAGIKIFRVDNPHTKPFRFWQWLIKEVKRIDPDVLFLAESFTRPRIMEYLAKIGFDQSYTYFTWRNQKAELIEYMHELTQTSMSEYFRPNFWPNTPDILPTLLQQQNRAPFEIRFVLAATLSSNYGIYGPAYEHLVSTAVPGNEEYLDSEKYEIKTWPLYGELSDLIARVNLIRRENVALQTTWNVEFLPIDNNQLLVFAKYPNIIVAVNLDPDTTQSGFVSLPLQKFCLDENTSFRVQDLLTGERYIWRGRYNYIELNPKKFCAHILQIEEIRELK